MIRRSFLVLVLLAVVSLSYAQVAEARGRCCAPRCCRACCYVVSPCYCCTPTWTWTCCDPCWGWSSCYYCYATRDGGATGQATPAPTAAPAPAASPSDAPLTPVPEKKVSPQNK